MRAAHVSPWAGGRPVTAPRVALTLALGLALAACGVRQPVAGRPAAASDRAGSEGSPRSLAPDPGRGAPAATLSQDALDRPAATAVLEADRAAKLAAEMAAAGHLHHGTYSHADAGRELAGQPGPGAGHAGGHSQHGRPQPPAATPDHRHQAAPAPRPVPSPTPRPGEPVHEHHHHHEPTPRPTPSPAPQEGGR